MKTRSSDTFSPGEADMPAYSDEQLILEALDDSHPAFEQLVKQYQYRVLRTIASIISDEQAAQDIAQETFLSAWSDLAKLKEREKFGRWLNRIAVNLSKDWLRDQRKRNDNRVPLDEDAIVLTQELRYRREKLRQAVWEAIDELSEDHREAIILHYISGYSYKEIGEMLSVPFSTVSGRLQKAKDQLRKEFLDMVTKLQLEIDSTVHKFLKEHAKRDGMSVEGLIIRLIDRYRRDVDASDMITRQIWETELDVYAVSPDGRYATYIDWNKANLAIHDFETGENRYVDEGNWDTWEYPDASRWSPDSKQIAYLWYKGSDTDLRIVGIDGSRPRVIYSGPGSARDPAESGVLEPRAWSRDGKHILAIHFREKDGTKEIVLVSVADGSIRVLKSLGLIPMSWGNTLWMNLSPDGRYVAYSLRPSIGSRKHDISLLATDGSHETTLVEHPANDFAPFWAPDGDRIVFASDRSGSMGIWVLEVVDGKPEGSPRLISDNLNGMNPLGLTQNGSYYYWLPGSENDIYFADLDPETGKVVKPPYKAVQNFEGFNRLPAFSPDRKRLVYLSHRGPGGLRSSSFVIRSLETGEERELQPELALQLLDRSAPRWLPDGRSILVLAADTDSAREAFVGFFQIHAETGAVTPIVWKDEQGPIARLTPPVWSPDGSKMFFMRGRGDRGTSIRIYDFETEREWGPDFRSKHGENYFKHDLAISPDGQQLAFVGCFKDRHSLEIAPAAGGETREVVRLPKEGFPSGMWLKWTPDGRHLLFAWCKDEATELWRIPVEGGEPENLGLTMEKMQHLSLHPDGHRIAFTGPGSGRGPAVWVMENILPTSTTSR